MATDRYRVRLVDADGDPYPVQDDVRLDLDDDADLRRVLLAQLAKRTNEPTHAPGAWLAKWCLEVLHRSRDEVLGHYRTDT